MPEPSSTTSDRGSFSLEARPRWVTGFDKAPPAGPAADPDSAASTLLIDHQLFPKTGKRYLRQAQRIDSAAGAQSLSHISLEFDPRIESLNVHSIRIWRDGEPREEAAAESFKILNLEPTPERQHFDPRQSANLQIDDVQPGDVIDIAATRTALPTASAGKFHCVLSAAQTSAVTRWSASVISGENSALRWQATPHFEPPDERQLKDGWVLRRWCNDNMPPPPNDANAPGWLRQGASIEFSEFAGWGEVASWAAESWSSNATSKSQSELAEHIVIECDEGDMAARADMALSFVRDEIRFIETDTRLLPMCPTASEEVIRLGAADRKDKASLLCDILSLLEIQATPVLVNTALAGAVAEMSPSPGAFDHVVVKAHIGGADIWIDPSQARLAKSVADAPSPPYAVGLPLADGTSQLEEIPPTPADAALLVVRENYVIQHRDQPATLQIECEASGTEAQQLRQILSENGSDGYFKSREAKILEAFPGARPNGEASVADPDDADKLVIREGYEIDDIAPKKESQPRTIPFEPSSISSRLPGAPEERRRTPWALPYPCRIRHEITFELPFEPQPKTDHTKIDAPSFGFNSQIETNGKTVTALFRYWSKTDHVSPGDFANYRNQVLQMATASSQLLDVARKRHKSKGHSNKHDELKHPRQHIGHSEPQKFNFKAIATVAVGAALVAWLAFGMLSGKNAAPPPQISERALDPLSESLLPTPEATAADFLKKTPTAGNLGDAFDEEFSAQGKKDDNFDGINFDGSLLEDDSETGGEKRGIQKVGDRELLDLNLRP